MSFDSCLLCDVIPLMTGNTLLVLNSAGDPFVPFVCQQLHSETITLAEDNIAVLQKIRSDLANLSERAPIHLVSAYSARCLP